MKNKQQSSVLYLSEQARRSHFETLSLRLELLSVTRRDVSEDVSEAP